MISSLFMCCFGQRTQAMGLLGLIQRPAGAEAREGGEGFGEKSFDFAFVSCTAAKSSRSLSELLLNQ